MCVRVKLIIGGKMTGSRTVLVAETNRYSVPCLSRKRPDLPYRLPGGNEGTNRTVLRGGNVLLAYRPVAETLLPPRTVVVAETFLSIVPPCAETF